jgi:hypothetical protein
MGVWLSFEASADGLAYSPLGEGQRISGGWRLAGLALPQSQRMFLRARGFFAPGRNGSVLEAVQNEYLKWDTSTNLACKPIPVLAGRFVTFTTSVTSTSGARLAVSFFPTAGGRLRPAAHNPW